MTYAFYNRLGLHVAVSNRTLIKAASRALSSSGRTRENRDERHTWLHAILAHHADALALYLTVQTGRLHVVGRES